MMIALLVGAENLRGGVEMLVEITIRIECNSKDDGRERVKELTEYYKNAPLAYEIDYVFEKGELN